MYGGLKYIKLNLEVFLIVFLKFVCKILIDCSIFEKVNIFFLFGNLGFLYFLKGILNLFFEFIL